GSSSSGQVTESAGSGTVTGTHVYADNGTYTITVAVTDNAADSASRLASATVANVAPSVTAAANSTVLVQTPFTVQLATFTDPGFTSNTAGTAETFTATIDWGDHSALTPGSITVTQGSPGVLTTGVVSGTHTYASAGDYAVLLTVTDDDGGSTQV